MDCLSVPLLLVDSVCALLSKDTASCLLSKGACEIKDHHNIRRKEMNIK